MSFNIWLEEEKEMNRERKIVEMEEKVEKNKVKNISALRMVYKPKNITELIELNYDINMENLSYVDLFRIPETPSEMPTETPIEQSVNYKSYIKKFLPYFKVAETIEVLPNDFEYFANNLRGGKALYSILDKSCRKFEKKYEYFDFFSKLSVIKKEIINMVEKNETYSALRTVWNLIEIKCLFETQSEFKKYIQEEKDYLHLHYSEVEEKKLEEKIQQLTNDWNSFGYKGMRIYVLMNYRKNVRFASVAKIDEDEEDLMYLTENELIGEE